MPTLSQVGNCIPDPGWLYDRSVVLTDVSGLHVRVTTLVVSFFFPIFLALVLSSYPTIAFIRGPLRRYRRRKRGLCLKCGYDLRGLTEPRCPECATEFDPSNLPAPFG